MSDQIKIAKDVRKEAQKTINALKSIGDGKGKTVKEVREKFLD